MLERIAGNEELKSSIRRMLEGRRLTHSVLLVGEAGLGAGFAARCVAADYLYPQGGAPAEALLRGECCRAVAKAGKRDSGQIETGIVREAISVTGMGSGGRYLVGQVTAMRSEIFNTSLSAEGRAVLLYHVERMNEESANALLKVMEEPPEGVLFLLTADSLAGVLPTIRSRCISFAVAPVSPEDCARYCTAQGVGAKDAALYSALFDGHIGTVLAAARDEARREQVDRALALAKAAAARDSYAAAVLLAAYEKDKAGASALLADFRAVAAAGLRTALIPRWRVRPPGRPSEPPMRRCSRSARRSTPRSCCRCWRRSSGRSEKTKAAATRLLLHRSHFRLALRLRFRFRELPPETRVTQLRTARRSTSAAIRSRVLLRSVRKSDTYS